jgi:hypothetical protein
MKDKLEHEGLEMRRTGSHATRSPEEQAKAAEFTRNQINGCGVLMMVTSVLTAALIGLILGGPKVFVLVGLFSIFAISAWGAWGWIHISGAAQRGK